MPREKNIITVTAEKSSMRRTRYFVDVECTEPFFEDTVKRVEIPLDLANYIKELQDSNCRMMSALDGMYNDGGEVRNAVIQHYGYLHD